MIIADVKNIERYANLHKNIKTALQAVKMYAENPKIQDGTYEIVPEEVILHVLTKETRKRSDVQMEIHKKYMDIHFMLKGEEVCGITSHIDLVNMEYNPDTDNGFWHCKDTYEIRIGEGEFYAVWPMEPHCPLCQTDGTVKTVRKIICKVKVD